MQSHGIYNGPPPQKPPPRGLLSQQLGGGRAKNHADGGHDGSGPSSRQVRHAHAHAAATPYRMHVFYHNCVLYARRCICWVLFW